MIRRIAGFVALLLVCTVGVADRAAGAPQRGQAAKLAPAELVERHLQTARAGALQVRSQAAGRLLTLGDVARDRLLELFAGDLDALAEQGQETVEILGRFEDPRLRDLAWSALGDLDFPWRPAALRGLAREGTAADGDRFLAGLRDPLAAVRAAAVTGIEAVAQHDPSIADRARPSLRAALADEDDRVRRAAAFALDTFGDADALYWPLADLERDDRWFELENGRAARYDALRQLATRLGDTAGYRPEKDPDDPENRTAWTVLEQRIRERAARAAGVELDAYEPPQLPPVARPAAPMPPPIAGIEVRSCRRGEFFLALGSDDTLRIGLGNPAVFQLAPGRAAQLAALLGSGYAAVGDERDFGEPGCDLEVYRVAPESPTRPSHLRLLKGPAPIPGLRPDALTPFIEALRHDLVGTAGPEVAEPPTAALQAVGGPIAPD